ncbi:unnamed protein product [Dracunculus medinensis]|uniref:Cysteine-rich motor neuron 1 protein n=1 Tax=Dracunculus medinensis TaxID=318479 RepID=A0A0N4UPC1_DRAME|nr:unnamed protein product [Dracunculus medinensis]
MWPEDCLKAKCDMVYHNKCPEDSRLVVPLPPPGECCSPPGQCQCDMQKCYPWIPTCAGGLERVLVKEGISEPGHCCDEFKCERRELHCENVKCKKDNVFDNEECPPDSVKAASYVPAGNCCPVYPGCRCRASICLPARCPQGERIKILRKGDGTPGRCCDLIACESDGKISENEVKRCPYGDEFYDDGQLWHSSSCDICKSHCTWVGIPENECCPVCLGCQTDGEKRKKNETWQKDDCTSCTCGSDGTQYCQKHMCQVECDRPRKIPGQCCPVCDEPTIIINPAICPSLEYCPLRCENGLIRDSHGCFQCMCAPVEKPVNIICPPLSEGNCDKICAHGYLHNEKGCTICKCAKCPPLHQCYKHCLYGFENNNYGCPVCKCRAMSRIDATLLSLSSEKKGWDKCFSLSTRTGRLIERDSGEWWNDGCRHCFCEQKHEFCSLISCPQRDPSCPIDKWKKREGKLKLCFDEGIFCWKQDSLRACCASCETSSLPTKFEHTVCQSAGRFFVDGETWQLASCISCTCRVGNILCRVVECPPIACLEPVFDPSNQCCPKCPVLNYAKESSGSVSTVCTDSNHIVHAENTSWRINECTSCRCIFNKGEPKIECFEEKCATQENCLGLPLMIKGRCCPVCSDTLSSTPICKYKKNAYSLNEEWHDGPCRNCTCQNGGRTICREHQCAFCNDPVHVQDQCCPICKDDAWRQFERSRPHSVLLENGNGITTTNTLLYGLCLASFLLLAVAAMVVAYKIIKWSKQNDQKKSPIRFNNSAVLLSSSRPIGSTSRLYEGLSNRQNSIDGQCDSLISTVSDSSSAASSNGSSGHGPHFDTLPLTAKKTVGRTKSVDYGVGPRRGFGSFKANTLNKIGDKHGSCNV